MPNEEYFNAGICKSLLVLDWNYWCPEDLGGSQFSSDMVERLKYLLKYRHLIIFPYHSQGDSMAEHRMKKVGAHLRDLVYELSQSGAIIFLKFRK